MGYKTAFASAIFPGLGQIINGEFERATTIWVGLVLSIILFPLPVLGTPTFIGIYIAGIIDAHNPEHDFELINIRKWKHKSWDKLIDTIKRKVC